MLNKDITDFTIFPYQINLLHIIASTVRVADFTRLLKLGLPIINNSFGENVFSICIKEKNYVIADALISFIGKNI